MCHAVQSMQCRVGGAEWSLPAHPGEAVEGPPSLLTATHPPLAQEHTTHNTAMLT